ncbi:sugar phosphate isomerase/epimerase family protein [Runella aurantiaca]|uniref:Sugar phosphate isomerase/epimerase n=1 Tax=Runella aurantiaca TaxID=2282308 RepID=A0A369I9Y7_9BACT|nr:sugar phosphate isomerase/epimerase family protein [Runella aurantiaca]RDB05852.1 sugar phosphate isomerase/epimerase [Runella aurantiaca]
MNAQSRRRTFLKALASASIASIPSMGEASLLPAKSKRLKTSLNAYSFNAPLMNKTMSLDELIDFCAGIGFDGLDITGYYFDGYPTVPSNETIYHVKRQAFRKGLEISGTGVRNDFTIADKEKRKKEVQLVKNWVEVAAKLGAPVLRIFAGTQKNEGIPREQITDWMLKDIETCVEYGKQNGVIIGLQNHFDFVQTADQVIPFFETIKSEWFGLILDTGSYRIGDPYKEIERTIKYAVNWQLKEKIFVEGKEIDTDLERVINLIKPSDYQGYVPIETLGAGDPKVKVEALLAKVKKYL